jgi:hypothetical protein
MISMKSVLTSVGWRALIVAILGVALVGFLSITRGTVVRHVRGVGAGGQPIAPAESQCPAQCRDAHGDKPPASASSCLPRLRVPAIHDDHRAALFTSGTAVVPFRLHRGRIARMFAAL